MSGFFGGEAQIVRANFRQLAAPAQAGEWKGGVFPAGDHQAHLRREMIEQKRQRFVNGLRRDQMVIVKDKRDVLSGSSPNG